MRKQLLDKKMRAVALTVCVSLGMIPLCGVGAFGADSGTEEPVAKSAAPDTSDKKESESSPIAPPVARVKHADRKSLDWVEWKKIPVFHGGRIKPLDSFAEEAVTLVTGRAKWNPFDAATPEEQKSEDAPRKVVYRATELLYAWLTDPEAWSYERVIRCEYRPLRKLLHDAKESVPVEGTFVALDDILDWGKFHSEKRLAFRSSEIEARLREIAAGVGTGKSPDAIGATAEDKRLNGKVADLFQHLREFLNTRDGRNMYVVPGLDPRVLTKQTDPDGELAAWMPLSSLLYPEKWREDDPANSGDLTIAGLMATDQNELLLARMQAVEIVPQVTQIFKFRDPIVAQLREIKPALDATRAAYDRADADAFAASMRTFARQLRRLADDLDAARPKMTPVEPKSFKFGNADQLSEMNDKIWERYKPLELSPNQMSFSSYPAEGSTDIEILYNKSQPFEWAWVYFFIATVIIVLSLMARWQRTVYVLGLAATLGAIAYATWGFALRILIAGRPPVSNMYETVIWVSYVVAVLGFWFCLLPLTWPGLRWSWNLSGLPVRVRRDSEGRARGIELDDLGEEDENRIFSGAQIPIRIAVSVARLAIFGGIVWFLTASETTFQITSLKPPIDGKAISTSSLGTWFVGLTTSLLSAWFVSRAALTVVGAIITLVPEARRDSDKLWEQTFTRRYFLLGALPVACFGMMLAWYVGIHHSEILNPKVGSIAAVLRNNYWLTIHVLTIVSSYGAGALAWGIGNLALAYYLFGKYRVENGSTAALADAETGDGGDDTLMARLGKAGSALKPGSLRRTLKAGVTDLGSGDEHLSHSKVRPPREVATLATYAYKAMQVAVLLLAAGTILGGLWADVSWGRFWDWDPKEVWALISLLVYLVVLHGRFAGWVGTFGTNAGGVLCFSAILFSWYGVNFVLPMVYGWLNGTGQATEVGLHSYATGAGGVEWVAGGVVLNLVFLSAAWGRYVAETIHQPDASRKPKKPQTAAVGA